MNNKTEILVVSNKTHPRYHFKQMLEYCELHDKYIAQLTKEEKMMFIVKEK